MMRYAIELSPADIYLCLEADSLNLLFHAGLAGLYHALEINGNESESLFWICFFEKETAIIRSDKMKKIFELISVFILQTVLLNLFLFLIYFLLFSVAWIFLSINKLFSFTGWKDSLFVQPEDFSSDFEEWKRQS
ncbi:MAG: hypothetical protein PHW04_05250 [Candidatus Wallbacteria bacterium]|nr:hypothetical protein [Candidatus Wallbacteria bacterium]